MTTTLQHGIRLCLTGHAPRHCAHVSLVFHLYSLCISHPDIPQAENPQQWLFPVLGQAFFPNYSLKLINFAEFVFLGFLGLPRSGDLHSLHRPFKHDFEANHWVSCFIAMENSKQIVCLDIAFNLQTIAWIQDSWEKFLAWDYVWFLRFRTRQKSVLGYSPPLF